MTKTLRTCMRISRMASEAMIISCPMTSVERVDGAVNQSRAVVGRHDAHAGRQARLQFLDLVLDSPG